MVKTQAETYRNNLTTLGPEHFPAYVPNAAVNFSELQSQTAALHSSPVNPLSTVPTMILQKLSFQQTRKPGLRPYSQKSISWKPISKGNLTPIFHTHCFEVTTYGYA